MIPDRDPDTDRGQVGIGTLIIFIALVLVAAVAAGVLINTAGLLESRASDTGHDAQAAVSNQIEVVSATGNVTGSDDVDKINLTVKKSSGSDDVDLQDATVEYISSESSTTLQYNSSSADGGNFTATSLTDDGSPAVLNDTAERTRITINVSAIQTNLQEGESAQLKLISEGGATTIYGVNVPNTLVDEDVVSV